MKAPRAKRRDDAAIVHFTSRVSDAYGRLDLTSDLARRLGQWDAAPAAANGHADLAALCDQTG